MTDYPFQSDDLSPEALGLPDRSDEVRVDADSEQVQGDEQCSVMFATEPPAEAIEAFERVFYAEHPQDCVRPLSKALRAFLDAWQSHFAAFGGDKGSA